MTTHTPKREGRGIPAGGQFATDPNTDADDGLLASGIPDLGGHPLPVRYFDYMIHVGTLDPAAKGTQSYEGQGLSVSQNPRQWEQIAGIGGPLWDMPEATLLDYHNLRSDQLTAIADFGVDRGYVERCTSYVVTAWDGEWECDVESSYATLAAAEYERGGMAEFLHEDDAPTITERPALIATAAFPDSTVTAGDLGTEQKLAAVWVDENASAVHGVWWDDVLDVGQLSAPRGVIVSSQIPAYLAGTKPAKTRSGPRREWTFDV